MAENWLKIFMEFPEGNQLTVSHRFPPNLERFTTANKRVLLPK
jgi:hypothetical protein